MTESKRRMKICGEDISKSPDESLKILSGFFEISHYYAVGNSGEYATIFFIC